MSDAASPGSSLDFAARHVAQAKLGHVLEFGVHYGDSLRLLATLFRDKAEVYGFDSFAGLPSPWTGSMGQGAFGTGGAVPSIPGAVCHKGWFSETIPVYLTNSEHNAALIHTDSDVYESARDVLFGLDGRIVAGTVVVFDEMFGYPEWQQHEARAIDEWLAARSRRIERIEYFDPTPAGSMRAIFRVLN